MDYVFGEDYSGFFASDYEAIVGENQALADWIAENMELVAGGLYYVYKGSEQMALIEFFELYGLADYVTYFTYLRSTWQVAGF